MSKLYQALQDNLFVKEIEPEREVGSLIIPNSFDADFTFGEVISAGPGTFVNGNFIPNPVQVGDEICFPRTMGQKISFVNSEDEIILVKASAVTARVENVED